MSSPPHWTQTPLQCIWSSVISNFSLSPASRSTSSSSSGDRSIPCFDACLVKGVSCLFVPSCPSLSIRSWSGFLTACVILMTFNAFMQSQMRLMGTSLLFRAFMTTVSIGWWSLAFQCRLQMSAGVKVGAGRALSLECVFIVCPCRLLAWVQASGCAAVGPWSLTVTRWLIYCLSQGPFQKLLMFWAVQSCFPFRSWPAWGIAKADRSGTPLARSHLGTLCVWIGAHYVWGTL